MLTHKKDDTFWGVHGYPDKFLSEALFDVNDLNKTQEISTFIPQSENLQIPPKKMQVNEPEKVEITESVHTRPETPAKQRQSAHAHVELPAEPERSAPKKPEDPRAALGLGIKELLSKLGLIQKKNSKVLGSDSNFFYFTFNCK